MRRRERPRMVRETGIAGATDRRATEMCSGVAWRVSVAEAIGGAGVGGSASAWKTTNDEQGQTKQQER